MEKDADAWPNAVGAEFYVVCDGQSPLMFGCFQLDGEWNEGSVYGLMRERERVTRLASAP